MKHLRGLDHPDDKTAEELANFAPEDKDTMERIFSRAEEKFHAKQDAPAEIERFEVMEYKPRRILTAIVSLAACAVIGVTGWGLWKLTRHKPPVSPVESVNGQQSNIPFYSAIEGQELMFRDSEDSERGFVTINDTQREQFMQTLSSMSWETAGEYGADFFAGSGMKESDRTISIAVGTQTPASDGFLLNRDAGLLLWERSHGSVVEEATAYKLTPEDFDALYAVVFGGIAADPDIPFRAAIEDALADGRDLQFYGNPDEEGFPVLTQAQIDAFMKLMEQVNWQEDETAYDTGGNAIRLFIPADDPMQSQTVYFYKNCITWSESPESSVLHVYPFAKAQYDAVHDTIFGDNAEASAQLPFDIGDFRNDISVIMTPAYAPNLIRVLPSLQEEIADAMDESEWTEVEEPSEWDGERTYLYVCGGESGKHYRLVLLGDYLGWEDDETSHTYLCPEAVRLAIEKAMSPPAMAEQNGLDPSEFLIPCDEVYESHYVWDAVDAYFEENADLSEYQEVVDRFNAEHRTVYYLWNREMCRQNGMSYTWFLVKFLSEMTPEEFEQYLADTYADSDVPEEPPSVPYFENSGDILCRSGYDAPDTLMELTEEQKAELVTFINEYGWVTVPMKELELPEDGTSIRTADGSRVLRLYWTDGIAKWEAASADGTTVAQNWFQLPDALREMLNK